MHERAEQNEATQPLLPAKSLDRQRSNMLYGDAIDDVANSDRDHFPSADWVCARHDAKKRQFPQAIAHRGYKAVYPENTLKAFQGAVEVGAHALETDIHLTNDDVVVLSHDPDLKRCFGREEKIIDCDWETLKQFRTLKAPHEPMPRLRDLLEYIAKPEQDHIWVLLDIKLDNNAKKVMQLIAETIQSVQPGAKPWKDRVVLGIWAAKFLPLCKMNLPGFAISHIGFSLRYAREFLRVPNVSFNILQKVLLGPVGARFIRDVKNAGRPLFVWTVNDVNLMKWSVQKEVDGVITDDPRKFREVCDNWRDDEPLVKPSWAQWLYTFWLGLVLTILSMSLRRKFPEPIEKNFVRSKDLRVRASLALGA